MGDHEKITDETKAQERREAQTAAGPGRMPTADEERAADAHAGVDPSVAEHERDMLDKGANAKGEGRIV